MERQVAVGRVFGRGFAAMAANPLPIFLFAVTFGALPTLGVNYALAEFDRAAGPEPGWLPMLGALALGSMLWSVASSLTQGVLTRAVTAHAAGRRAGVGECLLAAVRVAPALLVLSVLMTVAIAAAAALFVVPGILLLLTWFVAVPALVESAQESRARSTAAATSPPAPGGASSACSWS